MKSIDMTKLIWFMLADDGGRVVYVWSWERLTLEERDGVIVIDDVFVWLEDEW